jgi:hypothetical protein
MIYLYEQTTDDQLLGLISHSYVASCGVYDSPRIFADLRESGKL